MRFLVPAVDFFAVREFVGPQSVENLHPAFGQASQSGIVGNAVPSFSLVEFTGPASLSERGVECEVNQGLVECVIAGSALPDGLALT